MNESGESGPELKGIRENFLAEVVSDWVLEDPQSKRGLQFTRVHAKERAVGTGERERACKTTCDVVKEDEKDKLWCDWCVSWEWRERSFRGSRDDTKSRETSYKLKQEILDYLG